MARLSILLLLMAACAGCRMFRDPPEREVQALLAPLRAAPTQVALEVTFVTLPGHDAEALAAVWREVDESALPADARRALGKNGFRGGVLGGRLPPELARLIQRPQETHPTLPETAPPEAAGAETAAEPPVEPAGLDITKQPLVSRHRLFLNPGQPGEIVCGAVRQQLCVLFAEDGSVRGQTFDDAQPQFATEAARLPNGTVQLTLCPEIHHGPFQRRYRGGDGMFRLETSRDKRVFEGLALACSLSRGDVLLLGQDDRMSGSLGNQFFTESADGRSRRQLLLIRLAGGEHDERFLPDATAELPAGDAG